MNCNKCSRTVPDDALYCCYCGKPLLSTGEHKHIRTRGTGTIVKRPSGKYQVTVTLGWRIVDGKKRRVTKTKTFTKKSDAVMAAATMKGSAPSSRETLADLWDQYIQSKPYLSLSGSQRDKLGYAWKRLKPLEFRPIAELTVDDLQQTIDRTVTTYYPARDIKVVLSHLYGIALKREIVQVNKSEYIDLPEQPKAKRETWTDQDINAIWADWKNHNIFSGYILIMCYCGLRYGELAKLPLENIHLDERYMIGGIKTEAGTDRVIPIAARILPVIRFFYDLHCRKLLEMNEDTFYENYWDTIDRLQLRRLPPQTGRHYYFTTLTAAGVQAGIITETGGHTSYLTTMKNYVRIPLEDKLAAVDKINPESEQTTAQS